MKLFNYYKKAVFYPSLYILFFCIIYSILDNYNSELQTAKTVISTSVVPTLYFALLMCGLSLTIFLNKIKKLNKNLVWNISTWFLLPFLYIVLILIFDIQNRIRYEFGFGSDFLYLLIMTVPFVIGLYRTFKKYRQEITAPDSV